VKISRAALAAIGLLAVGILAVVTGRSEPPPPPDSAEPANLGRSVVTYGDDPEQFVEVWTPDTPEPLAVVVLVHGGFWRATYGLGLMDPLAADLVAAGYAVWNIEYRRVGQPGGGFPGTLDDIDAALERLAELAPELGYDLDRVAIVGHSAGGHLALWAAGNGTHPIDFALAVGQAPVVRLTEGSAAGLGGGAINAFLQASVESAPERADAATPRPSGGPTLIVIGTDDGIVPEEFTRLEGADVSVIDGADHFDLIDPQHEAWNAVRRALQPALG